jgi:pimeloyl-ACP methyl ester carboxylesterase
MGRTEVPNRNYQGLVNLALGNIHVPTMLVRGLLSDVVTQDGVDDLLARKPDVTVVEIGGAAHMIAGDQNDAFSNAVVTFLREEVEPTIH